MRTLALVLLSIMLTVAAHAAPTATALKAETPPIVDGQLNDTLWQGPPQMADFVTLGKSERAKQQTQVWLAFDANNLYLAVKALDSEMGKLKASAAERDSKVFGDDVIEIFVDPGRTGFSMVQLAFNALGTQADLAGDAVGMSEAWNGAWTVKTARGADAWTAEVAIPFANFGLSKSVGREWAMNVCRERTADGELSCWAQTGARFASPKSFGNVTIDADLTPFYVDLGVQDWGQGIIGANKLQFSVRTTASRMRRLTARMELAGPDGAKWSCGGVMPLELAPGQTMRTPVEYELAKAGRHQLTVLVSEGERLVAAVGRSLPVAPLAEFQVYKSFYRDDAVVRYQLNVQPKDLKLYRIETKLHLSGDTQVLAQQALDKAPVQAGEITYQTGALPTGQYVIDVTVLNRQKTPLFTQALRFPQAIDKSITDRMASVRQSDNMLLVGDKPFFPIGIYEAPGTELYLKQLSAAGFNLCHLPGGSGPALKNLLDRVQANDMKVWLSVSGLLDFSKDPEAKRKQLTEIVQSVGSHPALLLWESMDEPVWGGQDSDGYYDGYSFLRALDQQRPIWTNHAPRNSVAELSYFNRATDISGLDVYPVPEPQTQSDLPNKTISVVGDEYEKNVRAVNGQKPIFMVLQGFGWAELSKVQGQPVKAIMPTLDQSRFMAYQSIAHGANGVLYWGTHYTQKPSQFWSELRSLTSELSALQNVLASESVQGKSVARLAQTKPGVRLVHKRLDGHNYVILVNEGPETVPVTVTVPGAQGPSLRRLFEDARVPLSGQTAKLTLTGYDVAVLSDDKQFVDKRKDFSDEWRNPKPATNPELMTEPGNLISNPGFEVDAGGDMIPDAWDASTPLTVSINDEAHTGKHSLAIEGVGGTLTPLVVQRGTPIVAGKTYRFSAWVKAPETATFRIYVEWNTDTWHSQCLPWTKGTGRWQQVSLPIKGDPDPQGGAYSVAQVMGTGTVLFDDLRLEEVK